MPYFSGNGRDSRPESWIVSVQVNRFRVWICHPSAGPWEHRAGGAQQGAVIPKVGTVMTVETSARPKLILLEHHCPGRACEETVLLRAFVYLCLCSRKAEDRLL